jgi:hypothetical protein
MSKESRLPDGVGVGRDQRSWLGQRCWTGPKVLARGEGVGQGKR